MALPFSRKVSYTLTTATDDVLSAVADDTYIYLLTEDGAAGSTANRIYRLNKQGAVLSRVTIPDSNYYGGLTRVGNGFGVGDSEHSPLRIDLITGGGSLSDTILLKFESGNNITQGAVRAIDYRPNSETYVVFREIFDLIVAYIMGDDGQADTTISFVSTIYNDDFPFGKVVHEIDEVRALARGANTYYLSEIESNADDSDTAKDFKTLKILDLGLALTGATQALGDNYTDTRLKGLAVSQKQLIVIGESNIHFYGAEPPPPPVGPQPVRQVFQDDMPAVERFDIVRTSPFEVIANNIEVIRGTSLLLAAIGGDSTLQQRLGRSDVVPVWTVPDAKQGDKLFTHHGDADTAPTAVPTNRPVYTIDGVVSVGNTYRQSFAVTEDT